MNRDARKTRKFSPLSGITLTLGLTALCSIVPPAAAQTWPNRPIRFVVATGPGNSTDLVMRLVANKLTETKGWATVVDNRPGGNFIIGTDHVAKAAPDGYTALGGVSSLTVLPSSTPNLPFDILRDFAPVTRTAALQTIMYTGMNSPLRTMPELVAFAKANPGKVTYASQNAGTVTHMTGEVFQQLTGTKMQNVPYKDTTGVTHVMTGVVSIGIVTLPTVNQLIKGGKLHAIALLGPKRSPVLPDVPTIAETGFPAMDVDAWLGVLLPAATPQPIVTELNRAIVAVLRLPEVSDQLIKMGAAPVGETPQEFRRKIENDIKTWSQIVKQANIKFN